MERCPLKTGTIININDVGIVIDDITGEGSTCLVYTGKVLEDSEYLGGRRVTIKEFYPQSDKYVFDIERDDVGKLHVSEITKEFADYQKRLEQFELGYSIQKTLANSEAMEIMVNPLLYGKFGDSYYLVSDIHMGSSLERESFDSLSSKLSCVYRVAEALGILLKSGYMLMDFKPENLLWISKPESVRLLDVDSIIETDNDKSMSDDLLTEDTLYINTRYCAPEILTLKKMLESGKAFFSEKKAAYLRPCANVYSVGLYLFELLFERFPTEEDKAFGSELKKELFNKYREEFKSEDAAECLFEVLKKSMKKLRRFNNADELKAAIGMASERLALQEYLPKRTIRKANYTHLCYNMLEQYPLYDYSRKDRGTVVMDVAIVGNHSLRENLLKTIIPCAQMLNSRLNIHLLAQEAKEFWDIYSSEQKNPELNRTVHLCIDGQEIGDGTELEEAKIVKTPLAYIYLHTDNSRENILKVLKNENVTYLIYLEDDIEDIASLLNRSTKFVAYLSKNNEHLAVRDKTVIYKINTEGSTEEYKGFESRIYRMGLSVHEAYCRGVNPRVTKSEIKSTFDNNLYNIESSERSALHINYKLKSVGINPKGQKAPYLFYEKILSKKSKDSKSLFDKLVALEHRSWTAFMVLNGVRGVDDMEKNFRSYAYEGNNDWKKLDSKKKVICHPCLRYCEPGRKLNAEIWKNASSLTAKKLSAYDPLDQRCLEIRRIMTDIVKDKKTDISNRIDSIKKYFLNSGNEDVVLAFENFINAKEKIFSAETNSLNLWNEALEELKSISRREDILGEDAWEVLGQIEKLMRAVVWHVKYPDFRKNDEDAICSIPKVLLLDKELCDSKITVIKPMADSDWQNLFSTIVINPHRLVLVPMNGEDAECIGRYSLWLKKLSIDTEVQFTPINKLRNYGGKDGYIFIDETGISPSEARKIKSSPYMETAHTFEVENRKLISTDDNALIDLFNRPVNLTVQETLMLYDVNMISERLPDYVAGITTVEYKAIWNLYRHLKDGRKWAIFIRELERAENAKNEIISLGQTSGPERCESEYIHYYILKNSGLDRVLEKLRKQDIILKYAIPEVNNYGKVSVTSIYPGIRKKLLEIILKMSKGDIFHDFDVEVQDKKVYLYDKSLFVKGKTEHTFDSKYSDSHIYRDDVMDEVFNMLNSKNKDKVFQNIQFNKSDGSYSFRYSSEAVREVLRKEGSILEVLIYSECKRKNIFDDIRVKVELLWSNGETQNEIDIVGTKNSKTYFISAKMQSPEKSHIYEISSLCRQFSIEGEAILVTSHYTTSSGTNNAVKASATHKALAGRAGAMEHVKYIGTDEVDKLNDDGYTRQLIIADVLEEYIKLFENVDEK